MTTRRGLFGWLAGAVVAPSALRAAAPAVGGIVSAQASTAFVGEASAESIVDRAALARYYQIEWPLRWRRYEYGVHTDAVLRHYFRKGEEVADGL